MMEVDRTRRGICQGGHKEFGPVVRGCTMNGEEKSRVKQVNTG